MSDPLSPVLDDVRSTPGRPSWADDRWAVRAEPAGFVWLITPDGVQGQASSGPLEVACWVTEAVQEWVIEELWRQGSNWPPCPQHPSSHPMEVRAVVDHVCWACPITHDVVAEVGSL